MNRRDFTRLLSTMGVSAIAPLPLAMSAASEPYTGPFFISLAAIGGWDVTSFCDPKLNVAGERTINNWADTDSIQQIGNFSYAPVANNQQFFERFYQDMLIVNGVDSQTNSHDDGQRHTWSGRLASGYPSFGALVTSALGTDLPLGLVHDSGYNETAGITRFSRLQNPEVIRNLVNDSTITLGTSTFGLVETAELNLITQYHGARLNRQMASANLLPRQKEGMNSLHLANTNRDDLKLFAELLPDQFEADGDFRAAQLALLAYQSGLSVSAQLGFNGFDTHQNHDGTHFDSLAKLTNLIEYIFDTAEQAGFADKIIMTVGSDFGRTPYYNAGGGKDHWPIGSTLFIQKGASWGNRLIGVTDEGHNALTINPSTLQVDGSSAGVRLEPKHIQQAMRQLAGIEQSTTSAQFPLYADEIDFFA